MFQVIKIGSPDGRTVLFEGSFSDCQQAMKALAEQHGSFYCTIEHSNDATECVPTLSEIIGWKLQEIGNDMTNWGYASPVKAVAAMVAEMVNGWPESMRDEFYEQLSEPNTPSCRVVSSS
jgi:hypothetical protein